MDSTPANTTPSDGPAPGKGPTRGAIAMVVLTLGLLAALVWTLRPRRVQFTPAPLDPLPAGCPKLAREFVPTNITDFPSSLLAGLSPDERRQAIFRLNMQPCTCGCNSSVAHCRITYPDCEISRRLAEEIVATIKAERVQHR
jgi:hypothetical protein